MQFKYDDNDHQQQVGQSDRHQILPFERQYLVDTQAGECPLNPHQQEYYKESFTKEPDEARNIIHYSIEAVQSYDMEWHPATQEDGSSYTGYDKQVQIFGQVEETEVTKEELEVRKHRETLYITMDAATNFFQSQLPSAGAYLKERGYSLDNGILKTFRIGYAPQGNKAYSHLTSSGYDTKSC